MYVHVCTDDNPDAQGNAVSYCSQDGESLVEVAQKAIYTYICMYVCMYRLHDLAPLNWRMATSK